MPAHARELARLNQPLEPDLVVWLRTQNSDIKHYVNDRVRGVMNV